MKSELIGLKVINVRNMTTKELEREGWDNINTSKAIEFENGIVVYASCDPEGNGSGCLFAHDDKNMLFRI